jgi:hypothetical protein
VSIDVYRALSRLADTHPAGFADGRGRRRQWSPSSVARVAGWPGLDVLLQGGRLLRPALGPHVISVGVDFYAAACAFGDGPPMLVMASAIAWGCGWLAPELGGAGLPTVATFHALPAFMERLRERSSVNFGTLRAWVDRFEHAASGEALPLATVRASVPAGITWARARDHLIASGLWDLLTDQPCARWREKEAL